MKRFIPTRWSHLVGYSGVGALVRADNDLYVVKDIGHWTTKKGKDEASAEPAGEPLCYVDLLRGTLGLDEKELRQPPLARLLNTGAVDGTCVPALRFPGWTRCPNCGKLHYLPWRSQEVLRGGTAEDPRCSCDKHPRLRQVDWVIAHPDGGLRDVPWHFLTHSNREARDECRKTNPNISLILSKEYATGKWFLYCQHCKSKAIFNPRRKLKNGKFPALQPWKKYEKREGDVPSQQEFEILEVNDPRLYLPRVTAGLVIPPESKVPRGGVLDRLYCNHAARTHLERSRNDDVLQSRLRRLSDEFGCSLKELEDAFEEIDRGWPLYGETATPGQLLEKEYQALSKPIPEQHEGEDFVTDHRTAAWQALILDSDDDSRLRPIRSAVQQLVAVPRLREIRIFLGFSRVSQGFDDRIRPNSADAASEPAGRLVPPDLDGSQAWLPAIELYGEGIFFSLDEALLRRWERQDDLKKRTQIMQQRLEHTGIRLTEDPPSPLTPRFILLHTLAHLLIRRLEAEAGYPAASIRERIYCAGGDAPMAGILVYVAVPDIAGSLGGLAELAEPLRFLRLLASVFGNFSITPCSQEAFNRLALPANRSGR